MDVHNWWFGHGCGVSEKVAVITPPASGRKVGSARDLRRRNNDLVERIKMPLHRRPRIIHFVRSSFFFPNKKTFPPLLARTIMADSSPHGKAWPPASAQLNNQVFFFSGCHTRLLTPRSFANQILELVNQATQYKQLKKGANEGTKFFSSTLRPSRHVSHPFFF